MDLLHNVGTDLNVSANGDLGVADGTIEGQQRVLRRLMTNPTDYVWHVSYGAGLPRYVGAVDPGGAIAAVASAQMNLEGGVSQNPPPVTSVRTEANGTLVLSIRYVDAATTQPVLLTVPVV